MFSGRLLQNSEVIKKLNKFFNFSNEQTIKQMHASTISSTENITAQSSYNEIVKKNNL